MDTPNVKTRGQRLRAWRKQAGLTQAALASLAGTNDKTIRALEKDTYPHPTTLPHVLAALNKTEDELHTDEPAFPDPAGETSDQEEARLRRELALLRDNPREVFVALLVWAAFMAQMDAQELDEKINHVSRYLANRTA